MKGSKALKYKKYFSTAIEQCSSNTAWRAIFEHTLSYQNELPYCIDWKIAYWKRVRHRYHDYLKEHLGSDPEKACGNLYKALGGKSQQTTGRAFEAAIERVVTLCAPQLTCISGTQLCAYPEFKHLTGFKASTIPFSLRLIFSEVRPDLIIERKGRLLAVVSSKWTLRTDRAENARTESRNLKLLCNGRPPYAVLVTNENDPSRLLAVARGYDLGRIYHCNLNLLRHVFKSSPTDPPAKNPKHSKAFAKKDEQLGNIIQELVGADRLRDLSNLCTDLESI